MTNIFTNTLSLSAVLLSCIAAFCACSNDELAIDTVNKDGAVAQASLKSTSKGTNPSLAFCGDQYIYMIDANKASESRYQNAVVESWNAATFADTIGLPENLCKYITECKPVNDGKDLLITSYNGWAIMLNVETGNVPFHTVMSFGAHSADLLPDNRVAVACANPGNSIQIYDLNNNDHIVSNVKLSGAQGVCWNDDLQRLFAINQNSLNSYRLVDWNTNHPSLELVSSIATPNENMKDLSIVSSNKLCVAGSGLFIYDISENTFTEMTQFSSSKVINSANFNETTGEAWYTDATAPEGKAIWSTRSLSHSYNVNGSADSSKIGISDLDVYAVRVLHW
jgi:WD40 repeat protein